MATHRAIKSLSAVAAAGLLVGGAANARLQVFHASWEQSSWQAEASARHCALTHEIPRFGRARFEQRQGGRLQFAMLVDQPPVRDYAAQVRAESPPWQHPPAHRVLGEFRLRQGKTPLQIPGNQALRIARELEQGMKLVFEYADWGDGRDQVQVALMPVRFRDSLREFQQCTAKLLYLDFEPVDEKTVLFATSSDRLSLAARRILEKIALNYRRQPNFRLVLGGHADERGDAAFNEDLARRRASAVGQYLRARGVSAGAIEERGFGDRLPAGAEIQGDAWAGDRRVTVWLVPTAAGS